MAFFKGRESLAALFFLYRHTSFVIRAACWALPAFYTHSRNDWILEVVVCFQSFHSQQSYLLSHKLVRQLVSPSQLSLESHRLKSTVRNQVTGRSTPPATIFSKK